MADQDPRNLHDLAVDIQADLHKLAAGLVQSGVPQQQTQVVNHMADLVGQIAHTLGAGPVGQAPQSAQAAPAQPAATAPGPAQPQPSPEQQAVHHGIHGAVQMLHGAMQASKAQRGA